MQKVTIENTETKDDIILAGHMAYGCVMLCGEEEPGKAGIRVQSYMTGASADNKGISLAMIYDCMATSVVAVMEQMAPEPDAFLMGIDILGRVVQEKMADSFQIKPKEGKDEEDGN